MIKPPVNSRSPGMVFRKIHEAAMTNIGCRLRKRAILPAGISSRVLYMARTFKNGPKKEPNSMIAKRVYDGMTIPPGMKRL